MNEFITEKGTKLYWEITYDLGGYNYFTSETTERGYYLSMQRMKNEFQAFAGLDSESGACRLLVNTVTRKSKKQENIASEIGESKLQEIADRYGI